MEPQASSAGFPQGYRIWSDLLDMGLVLVDSHDLIRNLATNTAALWLLESGMSIRRLEKNPYAISLGEPPRISHMDFAVFGMIAANAARRSVKLK